MLLYIMHITFYYDLFIDFTVNAIGIRKKIFEITQNTLLPPDTSVAL